jgi:hypothetical protein
MMGKVRTLLLKYHKVFEKWMTTSFFPGFYTIVFFFQVPDHIARKLSMAVAMESGKESRS